MRDFGRADFLQPDSVVPLARQVGGNDASRPCYSSPRSDLERSRLNESLRDDPGVEIESGGPGGLTPAAAQPGGPTLVVA